jgi:opacity protein-like surface antigen
MMIMTNKKLIVLVLFLGLASVSFSQGDDFGIWYGISAEHNLIKKLELDLSGNIRTYNNASKIEEAFLEAGLTYKIIKNLSVAASYRFTEFHDNNDVFHPRHKWFIDLKGTLPLGDLNISGRVRLQERYKTYIQDDNDKLPKTSLRYRLKVLYNIPSFPVNPFISAEIFCPVSSDKKRSVEKNRFQAGVEYNISKEQSIDAEYIFQRDYLPHIADLNIVSLGYNLKF